jgi:anti-sigma regulatory factor (Ser/Thr protein kinase)
VRDSGRWRAKRGEERGRGLSIIDELMDDVTVERDDAGTLIRMRRRLSAERAA